MSEKNFNKLKTNDKIVDVYYFPDVPANFMGDNGGVLFPNGMFVQSEYLSHIYTFLYAIPLYCYVENIDMRVYFKDNVSINVENFKKDNNGIYELIDTEEQLSIFKILSDWSSDLYDVVKASQFDNYYNLVKDKKSLIDKKTLKDLLDECVYIGSQDMSLETTEAAKELFTTYLKKVGHKLWMIRILIIMCDSYFDDFFIDNSYTRYKKMFNKLGYELPNKKYIQEKADIITKEKYSSRNEYKSRALFEELLNKVDPSKELSYLYLNLDYFIRAAGIIDFLRKGDLDELMQESGNEIDKIMFSEFDIKTIFVDIGECDEDDDEDEEE